MDPLETLLTITHDIKNPLLAIRRLSERLLEDSDSLPEDARRRLALIHDSAEEASRYIEDLDVSSTLTAPDEGYSPEPVDLAELTREVVNSFRPNAECKSQSLHYSVSPSASDADYTVRGDPLQLREAMNNLVSNALKISPSGSPVEVQVRRTTETVCFSVADEGPGVSRSEQKRLFEPLYQAGPAPTGEEETSGVGLYIVKRIVEKHDGEVDVESEKGVGSTFRLRFPAASATTSSTREAKVLDVERSGQSPASPIS